MERLSPERLRARVMLEEYRKLGTERRTAPSLTPRKQVVAPQPWSTSASFGVPLLLSTRSTPRTASFDAPHSYDASSTSRHLAALHEQDDNAAQVDPYLSLEHGNDVVEIVEGLAQQCSTLPPGFGRPAPSAPPQPPPGFASWGGSLAKNLSVTIAGASRVPAQHLYARPAVDVAEELASARTEMLKRRTTNALAADDEAEAEAEAEAAAAAATAEENIDEEWNRILPSVSPAKLVEALRSPAEINALLAEVRRRKVQRATAEFVSVAKLHPFAQRTPRAGGMDAVELRSLMCDEFKRAQALRSAAVADVTVNRNNSVPSPPPGLANRPLFDATFDAVAVCNDEESVGVLLAQVREAKARRAIDEISHGVGHAANVIGNGQSLLSPGYSTERAVTARVMASDSAVVYATRAALSAAKCVKETSAAVATAEAAETAAQVPGLSDAEMLQDLTKSLESILEGSAKVYDIMNGTERSIGEQSARRIGDDETLLDYDIESEGGGYGTTLDGKKKKKKKRKKMVAPTPKQAKDIHKLRMLLAQVDIEPLLNGMRRTPRPPPLMESCTRTQFESSMRRALGLEVEKFEDRSQVAAIERLFTTIALLCVAPETSARTLTHTHTATNDDSEKEGKRYEPPNVPFSAVVAALALPCAGNGEGVGGAAVVQSVLDAFGTVEDNIPMMTVSSTERFVATAIACQLLVETPLRKAGLPIGPVAQRAETLAVAAVQQILNATESTADPTFSLIGASSFNKKICTSFSLAVL